MTLDAYDQGGTTCWWFTGRYAVYSPEHKIRSVTIECLDGSNCDLAPYTPFTKDPSSTSTRVKYVSNDASGALLDLQKKQPISPR